MSEPIPDLADIRQLRTQAKELLRALQSGDTSLEGVLPERVKLADAQLILARKYGFDSWPKLVDKVETPALLHRFKRAVDEGNSEEVEKLLSAHVAIRREINAPIFSYDSPAIVRASSNPAALRLLPVLVRYGADPNIRSSWWAGGFSALDGAKGEAVELLLNLGASFDVWSASAHDRIGVLRDLLNQAPDRVNAAGGDGLRPLHFAGSVEVAEFLIDRGANLEQRDVDHEATPIQHHVNNPAILRVLLSHGAKPDIFTAVSLNDPDLTRQVIAEDPGAVDARIGEEPFVTRHSRGGHIYVYKLGPQKTPQQLAAERGNHAALEELLVASSPARRLVTAAWLGDSESVTELLGQSPNLGQSMGADARAIGDAAQAGRLETVRLLLKAGLDPTTPGMDSGSALHVAAWFGYVEIVRELVHVVPTDLRDANHGSTPLSWAVHGSQWCRNRFGDYVGVVAALLAEGADPTDVKDATGKTLFTVNATPEQIQEGLRRYGLKATT